MQGVNIVKNKTTVKKETRRLFKIDPLINSYILFPSGKKKILYYVLFFEITIDGNFDSVEFRYISNSDFIDGYFGDEYDLCFDFDDDGNEMRGLLVVNGFIGDIFVQILNIPEYRPEPNKVCHLGIIDREFTHQYK